MALVESWCCGQSCGSETLEHLNATWRKNFPHRYPTPAVRPAPAVTVPPIDMSLHVTSSEFTDPLCANAPAPLVYQYDPMVCTFVNSSHGARRARIGCVATAHPTPVTLFYADNDTACTTPLGVDATTFPSGCHDNTLISCVPTVKDFVFRSRVYFHSTDCSGEPDGSFFVDPALSKCTSVQSGKASVAAACLTNGPDAGASINVYGGASCGGPEIPGSSQFVSLGCGQPKVGHLHNAKSIFTECSTH